MSLSHSLLTLAAQLARLSANAGLKMGRALAAPWLGAALALAAAGPVNAKTQVILVGGSAKIDQEALHVGSRLARWMVEADLVAIPGMARGGAGPRHGISYYMNLMLPSAVSGDVFYLHRLVAQAARPLHAAQPNNGSAIYGTSQFRAALGDAWVAAIADQPRAQAAAELDDSAQRALTIVADLGRRTKAIVDGGDTVVLVGVGTGSLYTDAAEAYLRRLEPALDFSRLKLVHLRSHARGPQGTVSVALEDDALLSDASSSWSLWRLPEYRPPGVPRRCGGLTAADCLVAAWGLPAAVPPDAGPMAALYFNALNGTSPDGSTSMLRHVTQAVLGDSLEGRLSDVVPDPIEPVAGRTVILRAVVDGLTWQSLPSYRWSGNGTAVREYFTYTQGQTSGPNADIRVAVDVGLTTVERAPSFEVRPNAGEFTSLQATGATVGSRARMVLSGAHMPLRLEMALAGQGPCTPEARSRTSATFLCWLNAAGSAAVQLRDSVGSLAHNLPPVQVGSATPASVQQVAVSPQRYSGLPLFIDVRGATLPATLAVAFQRVEVNCQRLGFSPEFATFSCTAPAPGLADVAVLSAPGGSTLATSSFRVDGPTPSVQSVTPASGVVGAAVDITVTGANLPSQLGLSIAGQDACVRVSGTSSGTSALMRCPLTTAGTHALRVWADGADRTGQPVHQTSFTVAPRPPEVSGVTPLVATLGQPAFLTVQGTNLTDTLQVRLPGRGMCTRSDGDASSALFFCDLGSAGTTTLGVYASEQATQALFAATFTVNAPTSPVVSMISPLAGSMNSVVDLTVTGLALPLTMQLTLEGPHTCVPLTRQSTSATFRCTLGTSGPVALSLWTHDVANNGQLIPSSFDSFSVTP